MPQESISEQYGRITAWQLPPEQFTKSALGQLTCGYCPGLMHPATSSRGLQFFAHNPGQGGECPAGGGSHETEEHLFLKSYIATIARSCGWEATEEYMGYQDIRPDVLCVSSDGQHNIAFEAQLSSTSFDRIRAKTDRHELNGIATTVWLVPQRQPTWRYIAPIVILKHSEPHTPRVSYDSVLNGEICSQETSLEQLVTDLITQQVGARRIREHFRSTPAGLALAVDPTGVWVFGTHEEHDTYVAKVDKYKELSERQVKRKDPEKAKALVRMLYSQPSDDPIIFECGVLIDSTTQVPDELHLLGASHAYVRYDTHHFLLVSSPARSNLLPLEARQTLEQNPDWILVDHKVFSREANKVRIAQPNQTVVRRMEFEDVQAYLNGRLVLKEDLA